MIGSGAAYGFVAISEIGAALQHAAAGADAEASRKWIGALSSYLDRVEFIPDVADHTLRKTRSWRDRPGRGR